MRAIVALVAWLALGAGSTAAQKPRSAASFFFTGAGEFTVESSEILKVRRSAGTRGYYMSVMLRGSTRSGPVVLTTPWGGPPQVHLRYVYAACAGPHTANELGFVSTAIEGRLYRDLAGPGDSAAARYWISFSESFCTDPTSASYDPNRDVYFICAGDTGRYSCIRLVITPRFNVRYILDEKSMVAWQGIQEEVCNYVNSVISPPTFPPH
jgi:hypothetical protein